VDLTDNPPELKQPYNVSHEGACVLGDIILKNLTSPHSLVWNDGAMRLVEVLTKKGTLVNPATPAPMGFYFETLGKMYDLMSRIIAENGIADLPAGDYESICGTIFTGVNPDTGKPGTHLCYFSGGWGGTSVADGISCNLPGLIGETYIQPNEVSDSRSGTQVIKYTFNDEDGGEGQHRGGRGICTQYLVRGNMFLIAMLGKTKYPPWGLNGGREGSCNYLKLIRKG